MSPFVLFFSIDLIIKVWYVFFLFSRYFVVSAAGIFVAYSAPRRHEFLKVVENNYCASRRGIHSPLLLLKLYFIFPYDHIYMFYNIHGCLQQIHSFFGTKHIYYPVSSATYNDVSTFENLKLEIQIG